MAASITSREVCTAESPSGAMARIVVKAEKAYSPIMDAVFRYAVWALVFVIAAEISVAIKVW